MLVTLTTVSHVDRGENLRGLPPSSVFLVREYDMNVVPLYHEIRRKNSAAAQHVHGVCPTLGSPVE